MKTLVFAWSEASRICFTVVACCVAAASAGCTEKAIATAPSQPSASSQRMTISGVVSDIATGRPIAGATVSTCTAGRWRARMPTH